MLSREIEDIIRGAGSRGWIMEPEAKALLSLAGIEVPGFKWAADLEEALRFAVDIGYPVVAKVVSPALIHKSDKGGVIPGIGNEARLREAFSRFSRIEGFAGMLVEEMIEGIELIIGGKMDDQFGPVVLLGMGGVEAEIYRDTSLRMAPLSGRDVTSMVRGLKARALIEGYRGSKPIDFEKLSQVVVTFSNLLMELEGHIESIDLNPVICSSECCVAADARIMLPDH